MQTKSAHLPVEIADCGELVDPPSKEKPWRMVRALRSEDNVRRSLEAVLNDLLNGQAREAPFDGDFSDSLQEAVIAWAQNKCPDDARFKF